MKSSKRKKRENKLKEKKKKILTRQQQKNYLLNKGILPGGWIKGITKRQFDAFCYSRLPYARFMTTEIEWFEICNIKLIAVILLDHTDMDYGYILLGRDTRNVFRCISVCKEFYSSIEVARKNLILHAQKYSNDGCDNYPQLDEKLITNELFEVVVEKNKIHQHFDVLSNESRYEPARNLIKEIVYSFEDPDGNYIKDFQSTGFDGRLWELYLHVYLHTAGFTLKRDKPAPDFHADFLGDEVFIEAVTVNPSQDKARPDEPSNPTPERAIELTKDYMPIKFGSPLFSKLNREKKYWEMSHVKGKPFVLAIHDFHSAGSMTWSRIALSDYLYGKRVQLNKDEAGNLSPSIEHIEEHKWNGKTIPSGFFNLPDAENISGVLFSNAATITKFNRMGRIAGLGGDDVKMIRRGSLYNPDPEAMEPIPFVVDLDDPNYEESWSDSLAMFHNPNAKHPIPEQLFSDISNIHYSEEEGFFGYHQPYDVLESITLIFSTDKQKYHD